MSSNNNSKVISDAAPHTIKKFEIIEEYIKSWAQKLMQFEECHGLIFIDCMCNSGVYTNDSGTKIFGTPVRVANVLLEVANKYTDKTVELIFNDINVDKIEELKKHLPNNERNFSIITSSRDCDDLLKTIGPQLERKDNTNKHFFLMYDPYDASIDWDALKPFLNNWGEVVINHMVSDSVRAVTQVKKDKAKKKYLKTYKLNDIDDLIPYGKDRSAYEARILEIISDSRNMKDRRYYVSSFPFFNTKNAIVYDLIHCTNNKKGFVLFKKTAWKAFEDHSSLKNTHGMDSQLKLDLDDYVITNNKNNNCFNLYDMAEYLQKIYNGRNEVLNEEVWSTLDEHPIYVADGFKSKIKNILKTEYKAEISQKTISFSRKDD